MSADSGARVLVLTAIREELAAFAGRRLPPGVHVAATGEGPRNAARVADALCSRHRPSLVVGAGVAGALTPDLSVGDLLVADRILDAAGQTPAPHAPFVARAAARPGARQGTLLSVDRPVVSAAKKAVLAARVGMAPAAVDMESAAWARSAAAHGIPFLIIRAISDTAGDELPGYLLRCMDKEGGIRRSLVALNAVVHPASIPTLLRMRKRVADCAARLGSELESVLGQAREQLAQDKFKL